jgi:L-asparagine transporter-like permease
VFLALISFGLYDVWDYLAWAAPREQGMSRQRYRTRRRKTSWVFTAFILLVAVGAWFAKPDTDWSVAAVNVVLCVLVVTYRFTKDMWSDPRRAGARAQE